MNDWASDAFWDFFAELPRAVQDAARAKHRLWLDNPFHGSLQFKEVMEGVWSVRINDNYRALARRRGELVVWVWIGTHREYERLIKG